MSTTDPRPREATVRQFSAGADGRAADDRDYAWVLFAGTIIGILATMNFIYGIAAVSRSKFLVGDAEYVIADLKTWGWVLILIAAAQLVVAVGIWAQWTGVRWVGVAVASLNAIAQMLIMPAYPFWALSLFALDVLVIYALIAHGGRRY
jgi:hypothetical protein